MNDRDYRIFSSSGLWFLRNLYLFLSSPPLKDFWSVTPTLRLRQVNSDLHKSRIIVKHKESGEYFNLVQITNDYQEYLVIHNCGETVKNLDWEQCSNENREEEFWNLQYDCPSSSVLLSYPEGTTDYYPAQMYTLIGTSQFVFIASEFVKDSEVFSSTGLFGFLKSYSETNFKVVGGLPTDNFTCYPMELQNHFWKTGYQNFSVKFVEGTTFLLTTFQVHDLSDLEGNYSEPTLFPLVYFEESTEEYSGRIAGELYDCWRIVNPGDDYNIRDRISLTDVSGSSFTAMIFKDGTDISTAIAVRFE